MINIYSKLPIILQNAVCSIYGYKLKHQRFGKTFFEKLDWLEETQWWTASEIENYQNEELRKIVKHAYETVPYYNKLFRSIKLSPNDIRTKADIYKIPILTKEIVRKNWKQLISTDYRIKDLIPVHTSGSTGKALNFYLSKEALQFQWAVWWRFRRRFGVNFGETHCNFTSKLAVPINQKRPPFWRYNKPLNQYIINVHHIIPRNIASIVDFLSSHKFSYYSGYPNIINSLCLLIGEANLKILSPPKYVFAGGEKLLENHRKTIENILGCIVTEQYGFAEGCGNASKCKEDLFHEDFEFGILECNRNEKSEENESKGEIIATGFANYAMPFIRYKIGDVGIWLNTKCRCGRNSKVIKAIDGRTGDYVITPEGRRLRSFSYVFRDIKNVKESQIVQKELGKIMIRIVRRDKYSKKDEEAIIIGIKKWISPELEVEFEYLNEIERESSGKFKAVKSLLE